MSSPSSPSAAIAAGVVDVLHHELHRRVLALRRASPSTVGTPANVATSASPVQSMNTVARDRRGSALGRERRARRCGRPIDDDVGDERVEQQLERSVRSVTRWSASRFAAHGT